jgi:hypothetical protein
MSRNTTEQHPSETYRLLRLVKLLVTTLAALVSIATGLGWL